MPQRALSRFKVQAGKVSNIVEKVCAKMEVVQRAQKEKRGAERKTKRGRKSPQCVRVHCEEFNGIRGELAAISLAHRVASDRHRGWKLNGRALEERGGRRKRRTRKGKNASST